MVFNDYPRTFMNLLLAGQGRLFNDEHDVIHNQQNNKI